VAASPQYLLYLLHSSLLWLLKGQGKTRRHKKPAQKRPSLRYRPRAQTQHLPSHEPPTTSTAAGCIF